MQNPEYRASNQNALGNVIGRQWKSLTDGDRAAQWTLRIIVLTSGRDEILDIRLRGMRADSRWAVMMFGTQGAQRQELIYMCRPGRGSWLSAAALADMHTSKPSISNTPLGGRRETWERIAAEAMAKHRHPGNRCAHGKWRHNPRRLASSIEENAKQHSLIIGEPRSSRGVPSRAVIASHTHTRPALWTTSK